MSKNISILISTLLLFKLAWATCYPHDETLIGRIQTVQVHPNDTLESLAKRYDVGREALLQANPTLHGHFHAGRSLIVPTQHLLPKVAHEGIVVNLAERRLYFFKNKHVICTYPVSVGQANWPTPTGKFTIIDKRKNPTWYVPKSIREAEKALGRDLPARVPPGKDNPLGSRALRLSKRNYLIHGTNRSAAIGEASSAGCLRLYEKDIRQLYTFVKIDTPVRIIDKPLKYYWQQKGVWLESHPHVLDHLRHQAIRRYLSHEIDSQYRSWLNQVIGASLGVPSFIGNT